MGDTQKKSILVVDDDVTTLRSLKNILQGEYSVSLAANAENAFEFLRGHRPDLILLDYMMPVLDGKEALIRLRQDEKTASIPVIFLTAISQADTVKECLSLNCQGYILKPVNPRSLLDKIARFFAAKK